MKKKFNYNSIYGNRSYSINDINILIDIHSQTIRKWIKKEGLESFKNGNTILIYGSVMKMFLEERYRIQKQKGKLKDFTDLLCFKCKYRGKPQDSIIEQIIYKPNRVIEVIGICPKCQDKCRRTYQESALSKIKDSFQIKSDAVIMHKGLPLNKIKENCPIKLDEVMTLCNFTSATNKTHIDDSNSNSESESKYIERKKVKYNPYNEILKYNFFEELGECGINDNRPLSSSTVQQYANAIKEFEVATNYIDFKRYKKEYALKFKNYLRNKRNIKTQERISKSIFVHYCKYVQKFFAWLCEQEGFRKIKQKDIQYLNVTQKEKNEARSTREQESHCVVDLLKIIRMMPNNTIEERRNKAMISLTLLTCPRISALQTARISSIKYDEDNKVYYFDQNPRLVNTKYSKHLKSFFIGQSQDIIDNVISWLNYLKKHGYKGNDYLFPKIISSFDKECKNVKILSKDKLCSPSHIRKDVFKKAFVDANLEVVKVHSFRHSMARHVRRQDNGVDIAIALSENHGHSNQMSTLIHSYGGDPMADRARKMKDIRLE